ncbi:MAG: DNA polymerase/3'-5' exonuclease PolX, partial [Candidatus Hydrogenedentes bacterium]|nr:DNA polymerase/3'-5' exonuclease PolX [Candidatus Hydrogenedentota bacterium]
MDRKDIAAAFEEIAVLMELAGENPFKVRSYVAAARNFEQIEGNIPQLVEEKRLREIKGIGLALEQKIEELVLTGKLQFLEDLRAQFPPTIYELFGVPGLGPKRIKMVYDALGIDSLAKLEEACLDSRLLSLKGFSKKLQDKILEGIAFSRQFTGQHLYNVAAAAAEELMDHLRDMPGVDQMQVAGSLRRCKEIIKDIDIVAASGEAEALMTRFVNAPAVVRITGHGETKASVVLDSGLAADLRVVKGEAFPFALAYFTGSKEHNVVMRQRAKQRGLRLNEYGLYREDGSTVPCANEEEIFRALDLPWIAPELREDMGEFAGPLPALVEQEDLRGIIHCHSTYSDGADSVETMARTAKDLGYSYLVISDHSQSAAYAGGLKPDRVLQQQREIEDLNMRLKDFRVLKGIESDIRSDGSLDYEEDILRTFEIVIVSVHSKLAMTEEEATARIIRAIENPYSCILAHPTGRLLLERPGYPLNMEKVFDACVANNVAIEINASCHRLDIDWRHIRRGR